MSILNKLRRFIKKPNKPIKSEQLRVYDMDAPQLQDNQAPMLSEVDFSYQGDLKAYVHRLTVSKTDIEGMISSGLLFPEEMKTAEKIIKIMIETHKPAYHVS